VNSIFIQEMLILSRVFQTVKLLLIHDGTSNKKYPFVQLFLGYFCLQKRETFGLVSVESGQVELQSVVENAVVLGDFGRVRVSLPDVVAGRRRRADVDFAWHDGENAPVLAFCVLRNYLHSL